MLTAPWLLLGIDDLTRAIPDKGIDDGTLLHIGETGQVEVGPGWRDLEASWYIGIGAIVASGTGVIVDEVFLDGGAGQERLRTALNGDTQHLPDAAREAVTCDLPSTDITQLVVLGHLWGEAIATEAALKVRESSGAWAEAYAVGEYQHGPIAVAGPHTLVWTLTPLSPDLDSAIRGTGARIEYGGDEPLTELIRLQRFAVALAQRNGRDADHPQHLHRAVVLDR